MLKRTSLYDTHKALGATLVPFAGWDMPVSYRGTVGEVAAVRERAGLFDVSHMGEAHVAGSGALAFLQNVTANDVSKLVPGKAQYSLLLNEAGGIIDDIIVYRLADEEFLVVLNAGCKDKDWDWLQKNAKTNSDVTLTDQSDETALIAVQGPQAVAFVAGLPDGVGLAEIPRFHFARTALMECPCLVSRTGYTGEDGFEIFCSWNEAVTLWDALAEAGAQPAGLGARDVLRLEAAYPLYGHELDAEHGPLSSGVGWAVKTKKGDFIGRDSVLAARVEGVRQQLVGLQMDERAIPREGYPIYAADDTTEIGAITSGTFSPTVKAGVAMARLDAASATVGTSVQVDIRGRRAGAKVVPLPFYRNGV